MWTCFSGPFGVEAPNENPHGICTFLYDLRLSAQVAGTWGSAYQSYCRDYDLAVGRYVESDPTGLKGGINTYVYAMESPLFWADPLGLNVTLTCRPLSLLTWMGDDAPKRCGVVIWHWSSDCTPKRIIDRQFSIAGFTQRPTPNVRGRPKRL